jgi:Tfp pilus assembly ATPase PilU
MNKTSEQLVSVFSQTELVTLMTAIGGYMNIKRKMGKSVESETQTFNKVLEALLLSNDLNMVEIPKTAGGRIGVAEGKLLLANEL